MESGRSFHFPFSTLASVVVVIVASFRLLARLYGARKWAQFYFNYTLVVASFHNLIKSSKLILNNYMKLKYILSDFSSFFTLLVWWSRWRAQEPRNERHFHIRAVSSAKVSLNFKELTAKCSIWSDVERLDITTHYISIVYIARKRIIENLENLIKEYTQTILIKDYSHNKMRNQLDTRVIKASQCGSEYEVTFMNV